MVNILKALFTCTKQPTGNEIIDKIDMSFKLLDKLRSTGLKNLLSLESIKKEGLEKEHKRLEEKFGANHPRVKMIAAKIYVYEGLKNCIYAKLEEKSSDES